MGSEISTATQALVFGPASLLADGQPQGVAPLPLLRFAEGPGDCGVAAGMWIELLRERF